MTVAEVSTPRRERRQLAKAELLIMLAVKAEQWKRDVTDAGPETLPFEQWPHDDPFRALCRTYELAPADLGTVLGELGAELEARAMNAGYDRTWKATDDL